MKLRHRHQHTAEEVAHVPTMDGSTLSALLAASQAVNSALNLPEALRVVLAGAKDLLRAEEGSVMLIGENQRLRIVAADGIPPDAVSTTSIGLGEGVSGKVAQSSLPMLINVEPGRRDFDSYVERDRPLRSALSLPLKAAGRTVGVLNLNLIHGDRTFTNEDLRVAQVFAEHAAMAIYKSRLLDEAQRRGEDLGLLTDAGRGLIGVLEMEPLLTRVLDGAIRLAPARAGFVCLLDEAAGQLSLGVYQGLARHDIRRVLREPGFVDLFKPDVPPVVEMTDRAVLAQLAAGEQSATVLPMRAEGRTKALLLLVGDAPGEDRLRLCQTFAAQAGLAIRNAQLYKQVGDKESELASIVFSIENPVVVVDSSGRLVVANPAAEELFGFSSAFQQGRPVAGVLGDPKLEALLTGEHDQVIEVVAGTPVPLIWKAKATAISTPDSGSGGRVLVMVDVTSEREMERLKADFVALVGHELRTPLTLIKGFVKTLLHRGDALTPEQRVEALATTEAHALRLERLIEDLLYVSRIETSRPPLFLQRGDLVETATALMAEFKGREPQRTFTLLAPASIPVMLDRTKVEHVIFHLVDNACKYSDKAAPVTLEVTQREGEVEVGVIDRGIGILSDDLKHVFERFRQVDSSSTRLHGGTGVGLYICKALVDAHGGRIWAESTWGKGSTFRFTIPKGLTPEPRTIEAPTPGESREQPPSVT